ncbi:MAG: 4Fe-4S dicluster domain-containing protein [Ruminococcaceae bacterium]|nr:4Fe-4S dicluster domain-containing protein [Oscillospiraceae bacterium]
MEICVKSKCTGCFACLNSCPKNCIKMVENEIGHIYPQIDKSVCIRCEKCKKVCPANSDVTKNTLNLAYAAYHKDKNEHDTSTSGGVAAGFSNYTIENEGVVYGSSSKVKNSISHIRVDNKKDLCLLKGSKYVHSYIDNCYSLAQNDLNAGKKVLFIGTPCQIAGLKSFLSKDYDNLITVDLLCHGVPPQKLLFDHLKKYGVNDKTISFRDKDGFVLKLFKDKRMVYSKRATLDLYFIGFNKNLFLRESCYNCEYSTLGRCSDITIGDFWGLGKKHSVSINTESGISVVVPNTKKGLSFWETVKESFVYEQRDINEAIEGNVNFKTPTSKHKKANDFIESYVKCGFKIACFRHMYKDIFMARVFDMIKRNKRLLNLAIKVKNRFK